MANDDLALDKADQGASDAESELKALVLQGPFATTPAEHASLYVVCVSSLPQETMAPLLNSIDQERITIKLLRPPPPGPYAALEWILPTAVVVFVTKSYFDGFLKEAGKDHYQILEKAVGAVWHKFFGAERTVNIEVVTSAPNKASKEPKYSRGFSLMAEAAPGVIFKLLLPDSATLEEAERATVAFQGFLETYYAGQLSLDPKDEGRVVEVLKLMRVVLVTHDDATNAIVLVDPRPASEASIVLWRGS